MVLISCGEAQMILSVNAESQAPDRTTADHKNEAEKSIFFVRSSIWQRPSTP